MMKPVPYMGLASTFLPLSTRNFRCLVTYGIPGMKIGGSTISKNFSPIHLPQQRKRNICKFSLVVDRAENISETEESCSSSAYCLEIHANKKRLNTSSIFDLNYRKQYPDVKEIVGSLSIKMRISLLTHARRPTGRITDKTT